MRAYSGSMLLLFAVTLLPAQQPLGTPRGIEIQHATLPAPSGTTAYDPFFSEGRPVWERDYLVYVEPLSPRVELFDKDKDLASVKVTIPGFSDLTLSDATVTTDGKLIVAACSRADVGGKIHCFIGLASRDGRVSPIIDTERFAPRTISTCDGSTVWAMGWLRAPPYFDREGDESYDVLRLYRLSDGKIVDSKLPRKSFPRYSGLFVGVPELTMQCRGTRLGIYLGTSDEWLEYAAGDSQPTHWKLPKQTHHFAQYDSKGEVLPLPVHVTFITGLAMLDSGDVYASFVHEARDGSAKATTQLFRLEKSNEQARWVPVAGAYGTYGDQGTFNELTGMTGKNLVYSQHGGYHWLFSSPPR